MGFFEPDRVWKKDFDKRMKMYGVKPATVPRGARQEVIDNALKFLRENPGNPNGIMAARQDLAASAECIADVLLGMGSEPEYVELLKRHGTLIDR